MKLWLFVVLVVFSMLGGSKAAIDFSDDPELEAMQQVFAPESEHHTGVNRLRWHVGHLKGIVWMLGVMNGVKKLHDTQQFPVTMETLEDKWRMYDIIISICIYTWDTDFKHDIYFGDTHVFPKIAWRVDREDFTNWITTHINRWGPDFFKYIVRDNDFGYNITNAGNFVEAVYTIRNPEAFASSVGMSLQQLGTLNKALQKAMLVRRQYWEVPLLELEIAKEMCGLGLITTNCDFNEPSVFAHGSM